MKVSDKEKRWKQFNMGEIWVINRSLITMVTSMEEHGNVDEDNQYKLIRSLASESASAMEKIYKDEL